MKYDQNLNLFTEETFLGEQLKNAGCKKVISHNQPFRVEGIAVITKLAGTGRRFSADDVHPLMKTKPDHPNAWGALFRVAQKMGLVRVVGSKRSNRSDAHRRVIPVYEGVRVA